ncbi:DUF421 domain-containing protein [Gracilibacillus salitolerans]|uniref:DUF421 domain-containing protein n=1 Tax=Gracilibacillus salitolerans TaxID=2663022 RepID=A0A5Q2TK18_9BACI|nr:YetF domain-containing protein [Gracilibacillus salitolerans]QGH35025.1 DUF421 domain-containing protein [Gracilibacillus salitolerans]
MLLFIGQIIILFIIYVVAIRILGKIALAQLTPHDFGAVFFLAYILFGSLEIDGITQSVVGVITIILLYLTISKLSLWNKLDKLLIGDSTFLVRDGKINIDSLRKSHFTLLELLATIRNAGYFDISEVDYAILEPNGKISILPKKDKVSLTPGHLGLSTEDRGLPIIVIMEGEIQHNNLSIMDKNELWLKKELISKGYDQIDKILFATVRDKDNYLQVYTEQKDTY